MKIHPIAVLVVGLALSACKSTHRDEAANPLPFHVALIPIVASTVRNAEPVREGATDMELAPDLGRLSLEVVRALDRRAFTKVTLLAAGGDVPADEAKDARDARWVNAARAAGADLVLECSLDLAPAIHREVNGNFWLDFPLFLIGGPFVWFVKDNEYGADVELRGEFYDVSAIDGEDVRLGSPLARVLFASEAFDGVDLNFLQRGGNVGHYAASILIPSGFLARSNDDLERDLAGIVVDDLSEDFAASVIKKRDELARSDLVAPFHLDPNESRIERDADGGLRLRGTVLLREESAIERMGAYRVRIAGRDVEREFGDPEPDLRGGRWIVYRIDEPLVPAAGETTFALELEARARNRFVRTYTFALPTAAHLGS